MHSLIYDYYDCSMYFFSFSFTLFHYFLFFPLTIKVERSRVRQHFASFILTFDMVYVVCIISFGLRYY